MDLKFRCSKKTVPRTFGLQAFVKIVESIVSLVDKKQVYVIVEASQGDWNTSYSLERFKKDGGWNFSSLSISRITASVRQIVPRGEKGFVLVFEYNKILRSGFISGTGVDGRTARELKISFHEKFLVRWWNFIKWYVY